MNASSEKVLKALQKARNKGITFMMFPIGFRLGARIYDLREMGHQIITSRVEQDNNRFHARYVLL